MLPYHSVINNFHQMIIYNKLALIFEVILKLHTNIIAFMIDFDSGVVFS